MSKKLLCTLDLQGYACRDEDGTVKVIIGAKPVRVLGYTERFMSPNGQSYEGKRVEGFWRSNKPAISTMLYPTYGDEESNFSTNAYFNELQWDDLPIKVDISISPSIEHGDE